MAKITSEILDRLPPSDLDAERAVLCSILIDPTTIHEVRPILTAADFYAAAHQSIYAAMLELDRHEGAIDAVTLAGYLRRTGGVESVGGTSYLAELAQAVAVPNHAAYYATIVREKSRLRGIIHTATEILRDAYDANGPADDVLAKAERALSAERGESGADRAFTAREAADDAISRIANLRKHDGSRCTMTGLRDFDSTIGGLFPGEVTILAARPGVGKTSLALQVACYAGAAGRTALVCSLEMSRAELATWQMCGLSGVSRQAIRTGAIQEEDVSRFREAGDIFGQSRLLIYERPGMTASDIRRVARKHKRDGLTLLVVDYLQLVKPDDRRTPREQQVASIARDLKETARELDIPVLCLCQLNRQAEAGEEPKLSHLRESGAIEQDADIVLFLWRVKDGTKLGVSKNRATGELGTFDLNWIAAESRYESAQPANYVPCLSQPKPTDQRDWWDNRQEAF